MSVDYWAITAGLGNKRYGFGAKRLFRRGPRLAAMCTDYRRLAWIPQTNCKPSSRPAACCERPGGRSRRVPGADAARPVYRCESASRTAAGVPVVGPASERTAAATLVVRELGGVQRACERASNARLMLDGVPPTGPASLRAGAATLAVTETSGRTGSGPNAWATADGVPAVGAHALCPHGRHAAARQGTDRALMTG